MSNTAVMQRTPSPPSQSRGRCMTKLRNSNSKKTLAEQLILAQATSTAKLGGATRAAIENAAKPYYRRGDGYHLQLFLAPSQYRGGIIRAGCCRPTVDYRAFSSLGPLGPFALRPAMFCDVNDVCDAGNWEGRNILNRRRSTGYSSEEPPSPRRNALAGSRYQPVFARCALPSVTVAEEAAGALALSTCLVEHGVSHHGHGGRRP